MPTPKVTSETRGSLLALEVEAGQNHPDTNVGKYWYLGDFRKFDKIVLFHIYTPIFNSWGWRKALSEFYAKQMRENGEPISYELLDRRKASDYEATICEMKERVEARIKVEFELDASAGATTA